jgi:YD repeat-containing protein
LIGFELKQADAYLPVPVLASAVDSAFPLPGLSLGFGRSFLQPISGRYRLGPLGRGWAHGWEINAVTASNGDVRIESGGGILFFTKQDDGSYYGPAGETTELTLSGGAYTLRRKDGVVSVFRPDGKLDYVAEPHGIRVTAGYDAGGRLIALTHSSGAQLTIDYSAVGRIARVIDPAGRIASYSYDAAGEHLVSVTDHRGVTRYDYVTGQGAAREHALASVAHADGSHLYFHYDDRGRLSRRPASPGRTITTSAGISCRS